MNCFRTNFRVAIFVSILLSSFCVTSDVTGQQVTSGKNESIQSPPTLKDDSERGGVERFNWTLETNIGKVVADRPQTARIFDLVGIDYCCGGQIPLQEAARARDVDPAQLLNALLVVGAPTASGQQRDWQTAELGELLDHIVTTHHAWLRRELPTLLETTQTVHRVHVDAHPELAEVASTLDRIGKALLPHLDEEENQLFPALRTLAGGEVAEGVAKQLATMRSDHDALGADLHRLRELTDGFAVPDDACVKYREMLAGLVALESDMHQHVHLENNVLLTRALDLLKHHEEK